MNLNGEIKILLVDDRDIIRDLFKLMILKNPSIQITSEAEDGISAIELVKKNDYDIVIMDINMPNLNGIETTKQIKKINPKIKILANSFLQDTHYIKEIIQAGASGYVRKGDHFDEYMKAIWTIHNNGIFLPEKIDDET